MDSLTNRLYDEIQQIEIIDTHEHLMNRQMFNDMGFDLFHALEFEYIKDDLLALGMNPFLLLEKASEPDSLMEELLPLLKQTQNTTYYHALVQGLRDLHGLKGEQLNKENLKAVSDSIRAAYERPDWYSHVIRDRCRIKYMIRDMAYLVVEDDFIKPAVRLDTYLMLRHASLLPGWLEKDPMHLVRTPDSEYEERVHRLDDYLALMEEDFQKALASSIVALKIGIAYLRTLQFEKVSVDEANRVFKLPDEKTTRSDIKAFQDFIMFEIIKKAAEHGLPVQIHTGLQAAGKNTLANSNPLNLTNIFLEFPEVRFDIFHGSFPFMGEVGSLVLMFPNVYLDTCWLPLISYASFKRAFSEWLSYVPSGKFLWGGDCGCAEGVYGAVYMIRHGLSEVLAEKIKEGRMDEELALRIARAILHDNAEKLFRLK